MYTLRMSDEMLDALNAAGREEVRRVLGDAFGVKEVKAKLGRPKRDSTLKPELAIENVDVALNKSELTPEKAELIEKVETHPESRDTDSGKPKWALEAAARIEQKLAASKAKRVVNHDPLPVEDDELPPPEL